ncbi:MAG: hypothetical protein JO340_00875 [Acidobacteriaceae bacterium]|nr:hypothetical protein [Acidobacteriaceae bacterium]
MAAENGHSSGNGNERLDRIERVVELVAMNQLAIQEQHEQDFKKLMTWQVLMQDKVEKLSARVDATTANVDASTAKIDRQAELQAGLIQRIDKLVIAIGELIRSNRPPQTSAS